MATINVTNSTFAGLANTKGTKTVANAKGAQAVTIDYLIDGLKNGNKDLAFARELGTAILNGLEAIQGRPAYLNGQEVTDVELAAYQALPAAVKTAIRYEPAVEGAPKMSGLIVSAHLHNVLVELDEVKTAKQTEAKTTNESAELNEAKTTNESAEQDELDGFLQ